MKSKRIIAYIFDVLIVYIFANLIFMSFFNDEYNKYLKNSEEFAEKAQQIIPNIKEDVDLEETSKLTYNYYKTASTYTILIISCEIIYFIFLQYYLDGQTLGKKIMKIQVKSQNESKLNAGLFVLREAILFNIPIRILDMVLLMTLSRNNYLLANSIDERLKTIVTIVIMGTIIFRKDERGLHDIIGKTEVIKIKKERK